MVNYLYKSYAIFCNNSNFLERTKINSVFRHIIQRLTNIMVPFWFNRTANNPQYRIDATQKVELLHHLQHFLLVLIIYGL